VIASPPQTNPVPLPETLGVISGTVTHGTAGMTVPDGLSVALQTLTVDFEEVGFEMGTVTQGAYSFENVSMREDRLFVITLIYNGTVFSSQFLIGDPAAPEQAIPLTIYEATTDPTVVEIDLLVTRIEKQHEEIVFTEIVNFRNTSDRLFQRTTACFNVPLTDVIRLGICSCQPERNSSMKLNCCAAVWSKTASSMTWSHYCRGLTI